MKVDQNNAISVKYIVLKFIQRLKPQIISIIYAGNPATVNVTITIARNVKGELVMINENK